MRSEDLAVRAATDSIMTLIELEACHYRWILTFSVTLNIVLGVVLCIKFFF